MWVRHNEEADRNGLGLGSVTEDDVEVNVGASGNFFSRKAINWFIIWDHGCVWELKFLVCYVVKDVDGTTLVDEDFFDCVILYFKSDDHRVMFLVVEAMEVVVREGYGRYTTSMMGMGNVVDGLDMAKVSLSGRRGRASTSEIIGDGVDSVA